MKFKNILFWIAIFSAFVLAFYILDSKCQKPEIITIIDTVKIVKYSEKLKIDTIIKPEYHVINKYITITEIDTIYFFDTIKKTIYKYYAKNVYIDTIINNDTAFICITDTIQENLIKSRKSEISIYNKTIIEKPKLQIMTGLFYLNNLELQSIGINAGITKNKNIFSLGIGTNKTYLFNYNRIIFEK